MRVLDEIHTIGSCFTAGSGCRGSCVAGRVVNASSGGFTDGSAVSGFLSQSCVGKILVLNEQ